MGFKNYPLKENLTFGNLFLKNSHNIYFLSKSKDSASQPRDTERAEMTVKCL